MQRRSNCELKSIFEALQKPNEEVASKGMLETAGRLVHPVVDRNSFLLSNVKEGRNWLELLHQHSVASAALMNPDSHLPTQLVRERTSTPLPDKPLESLSHESSSTQSSREDLELWRRKPRDEIKIQPLVNSSGEEVFKCPLCQQSNIQTRADLTQHLQMHQSVVKRDDGKHICCFCSSELSSNSSLERHLLTHTNHRPFVCNQCDKAFTTNGNLSRHMRTSHGHLKFPNEFKLDEDLTDGRVVEERATLPHPSPMDNNSINNFLTSLQQKIITMTSTRMPLPAYNPNLVLPTFNPLMFNSQELQMRMQDTLRRLCKSTDVPLSSFVAAQQEKQEQKREKTKPGFVAAQTRWLVSHKIKFAKSYLQKRKNQLSARRQLKRSKLRLNEQTSLTL
ncbi:hypothetical protein Ciccas_008848 [Cichlidogyrus casuarinus]|uniref:C2H2-type domain-containing protein n=1 Tax=Cichlidogyrus casuarinus TaxID=1844966 RepID=A0ABD2Q326_9PLAT